ncbi:MAG: D-alanine--D-alanine ligase [Chloroflexota bacterium]|nr:D-alanine--D-alanine ligase [Chloroflexota bacterium]
MSRRVRVGIVAGGRSAEHEVSIASAESVLRAIDRERFEPYLIYIGRDGAWHLPAGPAPLLGDGSLADLLGAETPTGQVARLRSGATDERLPVPVGDDPSALQPRQAVRSLAEAIDVAFLVLHGPFGEDGTLQGFLEMAGIPYTGAGVLASAVAMDKVVFKDLMRGHGLPVVDYAWFRRTAWRDGPERVLRAVLSAVGERSVVKPARLGSSVGMTLVHDAAELPAALEEAFGYDAKVIVERYVPGARELEVGVLGNDAPIVFEPGEVRSHHEWYDYEAKYVPGLADVDPRADLDPALATRLKDLALAAYRAVDCAGLARVDFLVPPGAVYISEMNTLPGFTSTSMYPKQAELAGIGFDRLIERLIGLGLEAAGEGPAPDSRPLAGELP